MFQNTAQRGQTSKEAEMAPRRKSDKSDKDSARHVHTIEDDDWMVGAGGYEDIPKEDDREPWRLWLGPGEEKQVIFLDGDALFTSREPFMFYQHQMKIDGNWGNFETCISGKKDGKNLCFLCSSKMRRVKTLNRSFVGVYSVIVITPYTIKKGRNKGKKIANRKMLLVAKTNALKLIKRIVEKKGVLTGARVTFFRPDADSSNTGTPEFDEHIVDAEWVQKMGKKGPDGFEAVMDAIAEKLQIDPEEVEPYDYKKLFKPKAWDDLEDEYGFLASSHDGDENESNVSYD